MASNYVGSILIVLLLIAVTVSCSIDQAAAQTAAVPQVGVSVGNKFRYDLTCFWKSVNPNDDIPAWWKDSNSTEWYQVEIANMSGLNVYINTILHFRNGTEIDGKEIINVGYGGGGSMLVYAANLETGSSLYPSGLVPWRINETISRSYADGVRQINHVDVRRTDIEGQVYSHISLYFDKSTGIMVETLLEDVYNDMPDQTFSRFFVLTESNVWQISNSSPSGDGEDQGISLPVVVGIIATVVAISVVVALLLRKKTRKRSKG